jgi:hypothetical protein
MAQKVLGFSMTHVGVKPPKVEPATQPQEPPKERFPSLYLSGEQVPPGLEKARKGQAVTLVCSATVSSRVERDEKDQDKQLQIELEVHDMGAKLTPEKEPHQMSDSELNEAIK